MKPTHILVVTVDGAAHAVECDGGDRPSYQQLVDGIGGGYLETLDLVGAGFLDNEAFVWFDEEGKIKELPVNHWGTAITRHVGLMAGDLIVGTVVFTGGYDDEGDTLGLSDDVFTKIVTFLLNHSEGGFILA